MCVFTYSELLTAQHRRCVTADKPLHAFQMKTPLFNTAGVARDDRAGGGHGFGLDVGRAPRSWLMEC